MVVIMVLLTFAIFLLIDYVRSQKHIAVEPAVQAAGREVEPRMVPPMVAGFEVPANVRFHAGHTWAVSEGRDLVRVGMDDFASKLTGKVESITLPQRGQWIRQGQKVCTLHRDGIAIDMVSPISFASVAIDPATNMAGFSPSNVYFTGNQIQIDWQNLPFNASTIVKLLHSRMTVLIAPSFLSR